MKQQKKLSELNDKDELKELKGIVRELQREVRDLTETLGAQQELMVVHGEHIHKIRKALHSL